MESEVRRSNSTWARAGIGRAATAALMNRGMTTVRRRADAVHVIRADVDVHVHGGWPRLMLDVRWRSAPLRRHGVHEVLVELTAGVSTWFHLVLYPEEGAPTAAQHTFREDVGLLLDDRPLSNLTVDLLDFCLTGGHFAPRRPPQMWVHLVAADLEALGEHLQADWAAAVQLYTGTRALMGREG